MKLAFDNAKKMGIDVDSGDFRDALKYTRGYKYTSLGEVRKKQIEDLMGFAVAIAGLIALPFTGGTSVSAVI